MSETRVTGIAERMNDDELAHWKRCYRAALQDCFKVAEKPMCVELAAHIADLSIMEYRKRLNGRND
jgi:hypothetical protein